MTGDPAAAILLLAVLALLVIRARWSGRYPTFVPQWDPGAEMRATALLRSLLSQEEWRQLTLSGFLLVRSPGVVGRVYRVPGRPGHVEIYDRGQHTMTVCVQPMGPLPDGDLVAMHKLMIEGDEEGYLGQARVHWRRD